MVILGMIPDLLLIPMEGESLVLKAIGEIDSLLETILETIGLSSPFATTIKNILSSFNIKTSPLDFLNLQEKTESTLQPLLTKIHNNNVMFSINKLVDHFKCLPPSCYNKFRDIIAADETIFEICYDGDLGSDDGDHRVHPMPIIGNIGMVAMKKDPSKLVPVSSLAIPSMIPFNNNSSFTLNPFANLPSLDVSILSQGKS